MGWLTFEGLNLWALLLSAVVGFVLGGLWLGALFRKQWITAHGFTTDDVERLGKSPGKTFAVMAACEVSSNVMSALGIPTSPGSRTPSPLLSENTVPAMMAGPSSSRMVKVAGVCAAPTMALMAPVRAKITVSSGSVIGSGMMDTVNV